MAGFHGRASVGLKLRLCKVPNEGAAAGDASEGDGPATPWLLRWRTWGRRRAWRRAALVSEVIEGSPAARAGIRAGDELLAVCGMPLQESAASLSAARGNHGGEGANPAEAGECMSCHGAIEMLERGMPPPV